MEDPTNCRLKYGIEKYASCFSQGLCLQNGLGGILTCSNSTLGFYIEGADCFRGQIGWPIVGSLVGTDIVNWILKITKEAEKNLCGYAPNEVDKLFPWYTYFKRTEPSDGLCLVARVQNDTFPLVTSTQCLKQCLRAISTKEGEESGCEFDENETDSELCPAKNLTQRLRRETPSPWKLCLVAYLPSNKQMKIAFEEVEVGGFDDCDGEGFYNPVLNTSGLCISTLSESSALNCSTWGETALVQCKRQSDGLWEFLGFTTSCSQKKIQRKWILLKIDL